MKRMYKKNLSHMNQKLYFAETAESGIQMERFKDGVHENATINKRKTHLCSSCHCLLTSKWQCEYCKAIFFLYIFFFLYIKLIGHIAQSCPTLCNLMDYTVHGLLQVRILEWIAFPFSRVSSQLRNRTQVSHIAGRIFTSWATREAQEYWRG